MLFRAGKEGIYIILCIFVQWLMTLSIAFMYVMIDKTTGLGYCSACLGSLATIAGVEYSTLWRNMQANSKGNAIDSDIKYCKGKYMVYEATHVKSKKGNNGKIREINQARAEHRL